MDLAEFGIALIVVVGDAGSTPPLLPAVLLS